DRNYVEFVLIEVQISPESDTDRRLHYREGLAGYGMAARKTLEICHGASPCLEKRTTISHASRRGQGELVTVVGVDIKAEEGIDFNRLGATGGRAELPGGERGHDFCSH